MKPLLILSYQYMSGVQCVVKPLHTDRKRSFAGCFCEVEEKKKTHKQITGKVQHDYFLLILGAFVRGHTETLKDL